MYLSTKSTYSLCLAYKINYPVVRAHHRQHETSPSTLLRSTNRPRHQRRHRRQQSSIGMSSTNDQKPTPEAEAMLRSQQRQSQREAIEPTSQRANERSSKARPTEPTNKDTDDLQQLMGHRASHNKPSTIPHIRKETMWPQRQDRNRHGTRGAKRKEPEAADPRVPTGA